ncbi:MAG: hypothetical protein D6788_02755, partial [Planctomycetota bacterium]
MPGPVPQAYLITFHTYGTWLHGNKQGSVDREHNVYGTPFLSEDEKRERDEFIRLKHKPVVLDANRRTVVEAALEEVCRVRGWTLHARNVRTNHVHVVVSADVPPERVMNDFKSYATRRMVERGVLQPSQKAWTRHGSTRYLWTEDAVAAACRYVAEAQGPDLPWAKIEALNRSEQRSERRPLPHGRGSVGRPSRKQVMIDVSYRVIADHLRCLVFAITDGAMPGNEGRGYVLRRILRRAVRYGRQYMNRKEPFLCDLVHPLVAHMGDAFPELRDSPIHGRHNPDRVAEIIRDEEASFLKTLDRGMKLFEDAARRAREKNEGRISGEDAFKLHDTYGFPIDLTQQMAEEQQLTVDLREYERLMEEAKEKARQDKLGLLSEILSIPKDHLSSVTDDTPKYTERSIEAKYLFATGVRSDQEDFWGSRGFVGLVFDRTCFYAEQGGQVGDRGVIEFPQVPPLVVEDTLSSANHVIHLVDIDPLRRTNSELAIGTRARLVVDWARRIPTMKNHTATHLLNWALREVLCPPQERQRPHVQQKGSLVDPEKTRFDFSHPKPLTDEELERIEALVNERIGRNLTVFTAEVDQQEARQINTLRAVFGEKYPDVVRVVSIGAPITEENAREAGESDWLMKSPDNPEWMKYSVEFCGGTHVGTTGEIERFVLTAEEAVAKGIRRVVGVTGEAAKRAVETGEALLREIETIEARSSDGERESPGGTRVPEERRDGGEQSRDHGKQSRDRKGADEGRPARSRDRLPVPVCVQRTGRRARTQTGEGADKDRAGRRHHREEAGNDRGGRSGDDRDASPAVEPFPSAEAFAGALSAFQRKVAEAVIPVLVRRRLQERIAELQKRLKTWQKRAAAASGGAVMERAAALLESAETVGGVAIVAGEVPAAGADALRKAIDWVRNKTEASAVLLASASGDRVTLVAGMSKSVGERGVKAGDLIREVAPLVGG